LKRLNSHKENKVNPFDFLCPGLVGFGQIWGWLGKIWISSAGFGNPSSRRRGLSQSSLESFAAATPHAGLIPTFAPSARRSPENNVCAEPVACFKR
jgi:hypothetical protein